MTPETLESVKEILHRALDLTPTARPEFVAQACADDRDLRREVESLLEQEGAKQPWREGPLLSSLPGNGKPLEPEQRIGPYRIVRVLGEGGMGTVALAAREDNFEKRVALKVVRPGRAWTQRASEELELRFRHEGQILAQLEHPNIARFLDGGTTVDGHPYFVMEYVEGQPVDAYCERRGLSIRERLDLVLQICSALDLAHQSLVVHRDIKPINILVTEEGVPKLLDFGIAKRLEPGPGDEVTGSGRGPMTLKYASPEQIAGRSITTGTDIYSLGVLLYQLLTGRYPYAAEADDGPRLVRAIREARPSAPSATVRDARLRRRLTGDLDSIVLKAMDKEPDQRYGSVEQLAEDIRRYLEVRPVAARRGTWAYRASKFARRHRLPLAAAAVVVLLSIAFGFTATLLWRQAVDQREKAVLAHERSGEVLEFMKGLFRSSGPNRTRGEELTAFEILERGEVEVEEGFEDPLLQAELLATIGDIYTQLGLYDRVRAPWERAEHLLRQSYPGGHPVLAKAINNLAGWFYDVGDHRRAEELYREALEMKWALPADEDLELSRYEIDTAKSLSNLATVLMHRGAYEEAERLYRQSLEMRRERYEPEHPAIARTLRSLGVLYYTWGELEQAEPLLRETLAMRERVHGTEDTRVATALASLGRLRHAQALYDEAEALFLRCLEIRLQRFDEAHPHLASIRLDLARLYLDTDELAKGEALLTQALEILRATKSPDAWEIAEAESVLGGYLARRGRYEEAEPYLVGSYRKLAEIRGERAVYTGAALARLRRLYDAWDEPDRPAADGGHPG